MEERVMILGVGLDVVEADRVARALATNGHRFEERVYTPTELADCAQRADRVQALAARFAAKEAFLKALGTGFATGLSLREVEVLRGEGGLPTIRLSGSAATPAQRQRVRQ